MGDCHLHRDKTTGLIEPFSNGTEHEIWESRNCLICDKGYIGETEDYECDIEESMWDGLTDTQYQRLGGEIKKRGTWWLVNCKEREPIKHNTGGFYCEPTKYRCPKTIDIFRVKSGAERG